ncbi:MAG: GGDEF domain-containing protein [Lachnospiraceae bacterium]|nr:GGDEF domain-containing protein [Lachnospiraceae bacterium]
MSKSKKRLNIGFFTCHLDNDYAYEVCKGVDYAAKELDVNLIVFPGMYMNASYNDPKNARFDYQYNSIFYYASKHTLDALIVSIGSIGSFLSENDMLAFLKNFDIPILTIEIEVPGYPYLYTEGRTGMREAVEHLIKVHGKTKIGMVSGRKENADARDRLDTYCKVLEENGIPVDQNRIVYGNFSEFTEDIVNDLLDRNKDLEAIVFANDQMAIGGYNAIKARGLEIGKDILITGYDDSPVSTVLNPLLTTVHNGIMDMGYHAVHEAINLAQTGNTSVSILNSSLIVRSSCGCGDFALQNMLEQGLSLKKSDDYSKTQKIIVDYLFQNYKTTFYYNKLLDAINPFLDYILMPIFDKGDFEFDIDQITSELEKLLETQIINSYFSTDKFLYVLRELKNLLLSLSDEIDKLNKLSRLFNDIFEKFLFHTSNRLYNTVRQQKASIWSTMYITRDSLTYSTDEESCFKLIMEKLWDAHFTSAYIYIYDEPVMLLPNGSWRVPNTLYLQACHDQGNITYLSGDNRLISSNKIFCNNYTSQERRKTMVVTPLFTNSIQYGLFVGEIDIEYFGNIYPQSLQLSISLNFISLMKQQLSIQKKLAVSATELNNKNELLNKLSITDSLTGINNRRGFLDSVQSLVNSQFNEGKLAMVVFADMDNLKQVNDNFGHKNGDFAIKSIAKILQNSFDSQDIIGRIGGDEFVAFSFLDDAARPTQIRNKIASLSNELNDTCDKPYYIDISVGITTFTCAPTLNIEEVLHNADEALYENKKNKRKSVIKPTI